MRRRKLTLELLILTAICMLTGKEGKDFCYYECDSDWWESRLWISRN